MRLHGGRAQPPTCYGRAALRTWADELAELWPPPADLFVNFNNDQNGCAPHDARWLAAAAQRAGLAPSRVPAASETPLELAQTGESEGVQDGGERQAVDHLPALGDARHLVDAHPLDAL